MAKKRIRLGSARPEELVLLWPREPSEMRSDELTPLGVVQQYRFALQLTMIRGVILDRDFPEKNLKDEPAWMRTFPRMVAWGEASKPTLFSALKDPSYFIRAQAALVLAVLGGEDVGTVLLEALATENVPFVERFLLMALGRMGEKRALPTLLAYLKLPFPSSSVLPGEEIGQLLFESDRDLRERNINAFGIMIADALERIGDPVALPGLRELRARVMMHRQQEDSLETSGLERIINEAIQTLESARTA